MTTRRVIIPGDVFSRLTVMLSLSAEHIRRACELLPAAVDQGAVDNLDAAVSHVGDLEKLLRICYEESTNPSPLRECARCRAHIYAWHETELVPLSRCPGFLFLVHKGCQLR